jgi:hypothetical protein
MTGAAGDERTQLEDELRSLFELRRGRKVLAVRCHCCGNREIASVWAIECQGRRWHVLGGRAVNTTTNDIVARRLSRGWQPDVYRRFVLTEVDGIDPDVLATQPQTERRPRAQAPEVLDVLELRGDEPGSVYLRCPVHGRFSLYGPWLLQQAQSPTRSVRTKDVQRISKPQKAFPADHS